MGTSEQPRQAAGSDESLLAGDLRGSTASARCAACDQLCTLNADSIVVTPLMPTTQNCKPQDTQTISKDRPGEGLQRLPDPHQYEPTASLVEDRDLVPEGPGPKASCCPPSRSRRQLQPRDGVGAARSHSKDALHDAALPRAPGLPGHPLQGPLATVPQAGSLHFLGPSKSVPGPRAFACPWPQRVSRTQACPRPHPTPHLWFPGSLPALPALSLHSGERGHIRPDAHQGLAPATVQLPASPPHKLCPRELSVTLGMSTMAPPATRNPDGPGAAED